MLEDNKFCNSEKYRNTECCQALTQTGFMSFNKSVLLLQRKSENSWESAHRKVASVTSIRSLVSKARQILWFMPGRQSS